MKHVRALVSALTVALSMATIGCNNVAVVDDVKQKRNAIELQDKGNKTYQLRIAKQALEQNQEFILGTSLTFKDYGEPAFSGMMSRLVTFKQADGKVQMLESKKGLATDPNLVTQNLVMSFPVVREDASNVYLAFNEGAASVTASWEWLASDFFPNWAAFLYRNSQFHLNQRYVDRGTTDEKGRISVLQVGNIDFDGSGAMVSPVEIRYTLEAYEENPNFVATQSTEDFRNVGFFEAGAHIHEGSGAVSAYATKFDINKPLTFAITSNTPANAREAIRDGILYWNRVLGKEWISVVEAPEGVQAPDLDYNLIQWVEESEAAYAYADAQVDPLTGEIRNAQVFLPSGWLNSSFWMTNQFARLSGNPKLTKQNITQKLMGQGFKLKNGSTDTNRRNSRAIGQCSHVNREVVQRGLTQLSTRGMSSEAIERSMLDYLRAVVAHEVGHTLGLRHNFAGSLGTNMTLAENDAAIAKYLETGDWDAAKIPGSSAMEYPAFVDDLSIGARIRLGHEPLAYDVMAIRKLYLDEALPANPPLFCTDSELWFGGATDCTTWDRGTSFVEYLHDSANSAVRNAAAEYLLWAQYAKSLGRDNVLEFITPEYDASLSYDYRFFLAMQLGDQTRFLKESRTLLTDGSSAAYRAVKEASLARALKDVENLGGYPAVFPTLPADFETQFKTELERLLSYEWLTKGQKPTGGEWSFSESDLAQLKEYANSYVQTYRRMSAMYDMDLAALESPFMSYVVDFDPSYADSFVATPSKWKAPGIEKWVAERATQTLTAREGTFPATIEVMSLDGTQKENKKAELPKFKYSKLIRNKAIAALDPLTHSDNPAWAYDEKNKLARDFLSVLDGVISDVAFSRFLVPGSSPEGKTWILENQELNNQFTPPEPETIK